MAGRHRPAGSTTLGDTLYENARPPPPASPATRQRRKTSSPRPAPGSIRRPRIRHVAGPDLPAAAALTWAPGQNADLAANYDPPHRQPPRTPCPSAGPLSHADPRPGPGDPSPTSWGLPQRRRVRLHHPRHVRRPVPTAAGTSSPGRPGHRQPRHRLSGPGRAAGLRIQRPRHRRVSSTPAYVQNGITSPSLYHPLATADFATASQCRFSRPAAAAVSPPSPRP